METLLRLELVCLGLDQLELQADIFDENGQWIGRFDAADRAKKRLMEYDGEQHRLDRAQYLRDTEKHDRARGAGYRILRVHKEDFAPSRIAATRQKICSFLGEEPRPIPRELAHYLR